MASAGGSPVLPAWGQNVRANSPVTIECLGETYEARAVEAVDVERDRVLGRMVRALPRLGEYQTTVERKIPLFRLVRG